MVLLLTFFTVCAVTLYAVVSEYQAIQKAKLVAATTAAARTEVELVLGDLRKHLNQRAGAPIPLESSAFAEVAKESCGANGSTGALPCEGIQVNKVLDGESKPMRIEYTTRCVEGGGVVNYNSIPQMSTSGLTCGMLEHPVIEVKTWDRYDSGRPTEGFVITNYPQPNSGMGASLCARFRQDTTCNNVGEVVLDMAELFPSEDSYAVVRKATIVPMLSYRASNANTLTSD